MTGLRGLIVAAAPLEAVIGFLTARFAVVSRPHAPAVPFHWRLTAHDDDSGRCRLVVLAGQQAGRWFYDVLPGGGRAA